MNPHRILLDYLASKGFSEARDTLSIPEEYRHLFMGEASISLKDGTFGDFALQRVLHFLDTEGPSYFRIALSGIPEQLAFAQDTEGPLLGGCFLVQYEAHKLVEEIRCAVASLNQGEAVSPADILTWLHEASPAKIYFRPDELQSYLVTLRGVIKESLTPTVDELRAAMASQLEEEVRRVEEYYRMLKGSANSVEDRTRYEQEEQHLISQYVRRLHPSNLQIRATPVILFSLVFSEQS